MTERLAEVEGQIATLRQLGQVVGAIRAIAAARGRAARSRLEAVRAHAGIVARAIGRALALAPAPEPAPAGSGRGGRIVVAFCGEQGFAGAFSTAVLDRLADAEAEAAWGGGMPATLLVVGDRGLLAAHERDLAVAWSTPMVLHQDRAAELAARLVDEVWRRLEAAPIDRVDLLHWMPDGGSGGSVVRRRLLPFDFARFPPEPSAVAPILTLTPEALTARLVEEYVFAELCEAAILSFVAENEARVRAMTAAGDRIGEKLEAELAEARRLRQESITGEIVELASGAMALAAKRRRARGPAAFAADQVAAPAKGG